MKTKRVVTIQDLSCVGQCSLTVALPVMSALGVETAVLPTSILSNHTMFSAWTKLDMDSEVEKIVAEWKNQGFTFDALSTGYVGNSNLVNLVNQLKTDLNCKLTIIDPAMADNGKLYPGFDDGYVSAMKNLCYGADVILPNISEACLLLGIDYKEFSLEDFKQIAIRLSEQFNASVVLKGAQKEDKLGVLVYDKNSGKLQSYFHEKMSRSYHGTGDIYASVFVGMVLNGYDYLESASRAADFVVKAIADTIEDSEHFYGVHFERNMHLLGKFIK